MDLPSILFSCPTAAVQIKRVRGGEKKKAMTSVWRESITAVPLPRLGFISLERDLDSITKPSLFHCGMKQRQGKGEREGERKAGKRKIIISCFNGNSPLGEIRDLRVHVDALKRQWLSLEPPWLKWYQENMEGLQYSQGPSGDPESCLAGKYMKAGME